MGAVPPMSTILLDDQPLSSRRITAMILLALGGGAISVKAFLSTTYTDYQEAKNTDAKIATLQQFPTLK